MKKPKTAKRDYDPYDNRVISQEPPKCIVTGDPWDNPVEFTLEKEKGGKNGTSENTL